MKSTSTEKQRVTLDLDPDLYRLLALRAVENKTADTDDPPTMAEICREAIDFYLLRMSPRQIARFRKLAREDGEVAA